MPLNDRNGACILVVDDAPETLSFICDALDSAGFTILVATDGATALKRLRCVEPDAILLDANMPGMDGFEVCRRIKSDQLWSAIPVIFMTGFSETGHIVEGFRAGGVDYVTKPVHPDELIARILTHTQNARAIRQTRVALDVAGHAIAVIGPAGELSWRSKLAEQWLEEFFAAAPDGLPEPIRRWLTADVSNKDSALVTISGCRRLTIRAIGSVNLGEQVLLLHVDSMTSAHDQSARRPALTSRETEVLYWLARGKTNRDIADILEMSPRTVSKHLEHIYEKLGVETRSAATARALRDLLIKPV